MSAVYLRCKVEVRVLILDVALLLAEDLLPGIDRLVRQPECGQAGPLRQLNIAHNR